MKDPVTLSEEVLACDSSVDKSDNSSLNEAENESEASQNKEEPKNRKRKSRKLENGAKNDTKNGSVDNLSNEKDSVAETPKMNAFQFMMSSRHKSIGGNSPGRDLDLNESTDSVISKKELKSRKSRLESWAEQKGATKRKREYEEVGNCINRKLEKREKKLKKLLKVDCQSDDEVITKRRRKCVVIESDSDEESLEKVEKKKNISRLSLKKKEKKVESEVKLTPKSVKNWKLKIKLCMEENKENGEVEGNVDIEQNDNVQNNEPSILNESSDCVLITDAKPEENDKGIDEKRVLRSRRSKPKIYDDYFLSDDDDDDSTKKKKDKKIIKVAPVFLKAVPKPKLDPEVIEARRQFLMSGVPSSLKKEMEKQQCTEEIDFDVFPTISHVQQKSPNNSFWDLPTVELELIEEKEEKFEIEPFSRKLLFLENSSDSAIEDHIIPKIKNCKKIVREIKSLHPDYPVYKIFNSIYAKSGYKIEKPEYTEKIVEQQTPKRRGRPKKTQSVVPTIKPEIKNEENNIYAMWTEKYKPKSSSDIIGNHNSVSSLKDWLTNWIKTDSRKKKKKSSDSESEFVTDSDSRDSAKTFGNTVILKGPTGCGKTAAAYAVCQELGFNVLEVNASSKRSGKRLLQELQEATQSHQVCKSENILSKFVKETKDKVSKPKKCVILVEDVDIVFEQDEGFTAALSQIIATSKRPIILTMTDEPCTSIQKITNEHQTINFSPLSSILTVWLQIVCLVEGFFLNTKSLEDLLNYNKGDIRRTLLHLQLYVNSGGQRGNSTNKVESTVKIDDDSSNVKIDDDCSNMSDMKLDESSDCREEIFAHHDCIDSCQLVKKYTSFSLPFCNNLEIIWWNWSSILNMSNFASSRLQRSETNENKQTNESDKKQLKSLSDCYESLSFVDDISGKNQYCDSLERRWRTKTKDSLGLEESMDGFKDDICNELAQTILSGRIKLYKEKYNEEICNLNMAVPSTLEKRWRRKQLASEEDLHQILPVSELVSRKSISLDYMPCLRTIVRSECERAANNTKRSNRFYHYLRNLGVRCSDSSYKMACDVFKVWD